MGPGFDSLGIALELRARLTVEFGAASGGSTSDPMSRMTLQAARLVFERQGAEVPPMFGGMDGDIPVGRGLGASAIARVAGVLAANEHLGCPLSEDGVLALASELEGHADNAAPALLGGMQVAVESEEGAWVRLAVPVPDSLQAAVLIPEMPMPTREARKVMPANYSRAEAVFNLGRTALLVAAMTQGRLDLLREATRDRIHQPARARLFPPLFDVFEAAIGAGAHAVWLSGAGSSILALVSEGPQVVGQAMLAASERRGYPARYVVTRPSMSGARLE
jgi:homoserine kinase